MSDATGTVEGTTTDTTLTDNVTVKTLTKVQLLEQVKAIADDVFAGINAVEGLEKTISLGVVTNVDSLLDLKSSWTLDAKQLTNHAPL